MLVCEETFAPRLMAPLLAEVREMAPDVEVKVAPAFKVKRP